MKSKNLALVMPGLLIIGVMTGCSPNHESGSVEIEVRAMAPGAEGRSYEVAILTRDGEFADSQEISVDSGYAVEGLSLGWISVESSSGCKVESELTKDSPDMKVVIDGESCILNG